MCDPATAMIAISSVSSSLGMFKGLMEQNASVKQSNNQIRESLIQAKSAREEAGNARQAGIEESRNKRLKAILETGDASTKIASGNLSVLSGTSSNIFDTKKMYADDEAENILKNANRTSDSYLRKADEYYKNAELTSLTAKKNKQIFGVDMLVGGLQNTASLAGIL